MHSIGFWAATTFRHRWSSLMVEVAWTGFTPIVRMRTEVRSRQFATFSVLPRCVSSHALPDMPGKRVTVVRVTYGPGGFTPPHRHAGTVTAYITKGQIRSQLKGGPVEIFDVGQSFFEPPGAIHMVSANASNTEWAELIAVFVADEGAQLTTLIEP